MKMRAMGFCGADDSIAPKLLQMLSMHYPWIEWGVLFRPDLEGTPRYASMSWVERLAACAHQTPMKLAGHLCGSRCQEVLEGNHAFVKELTLLGFKRVQINATAANKVVVLPDKVNEYVANLLNCMKNVPEIEWIIQCNEETKAIWQPLVQNPPENMSILFDASCGLGVPMIEFPKPLPHVKCGYAGGIGPDNIADMLNRIFAAANDIPIWIDMESSLRSTILDPKHGSKDVFSIEKCFTCADIGVTSFGLSMNNY
ncbi:hypothetical protein THRCLA_08731 [Thraustotheca clavata]|uniref:Uncharacterized protein n=1 Tax=Thraustotheca clavata TaxID=74557 RepID=A0A1V9Z3A7_9STRA|nr:hypothetical protein THRCLA_08731 [Thraustotheca clavata]